ncbi:MAG: choice-of-anchor D domain-containing protein, partial [Candidatus Caldarchaeum sp.]
FEGKLAQKGKRIGQVRVMFDETNRIAIIGIANEGVDEKIAHQVRVKIKADKDDEPEDDAEPAIQATACGQATGEAVPEGAKMQPLALPPGEGDFEGGYEGPQICTSQWGYDYLCLSRTPAISLSTATLTLPQTFINQQTQSSFVIWNSGGGTLTGTVSVPAPFSIVSGSSFSLLPGQPQEVVVRFSSATPGSFSKSVSISSTGGSKTVTATGVAHKVSFSPAQVDFGSGLLVLREQCNKMDVCGLRTEKVGLPIEKALTVKNEGTVAVTLTLSTAAPYKIVSVLPTLSPGQSGQVTVRFDPSESGSFAGAVQVGIQDGQGSVSSSPLVGVVHKIEIDPAELDFGIVFVGDSREQKLTVRNQGVTTVTLTVNTATPFSIASESSFTLIPSESREVTVRIDPTASGTLLSNVRCTVGLASVAVPSRAQAMTHEEYWQMMFEAYTTARQQGQAGFTVWDASRVLSLVGFPELTQGELQGLWESFYALASGSLSTEVAQAVEILRTISSEQLQEWLWALVVAEREGRFEEEYARLVSSGLDRYMQALRLLYNLEKQQVKEILHSYIAGLAQTPGSSWEAVILNLAAVGNEFDKAYQIFLKWARQQGFADPDMTARRLASELVIALGGAMAQLGSGSRAQELKENINVVLDIFNSGQYSDVDAGRLLIQLMSVLDEMARGIAVDQNEALTRTLARTMESQLWRVIDIRIALVVGDPRTGIQQRVIIDLVFRNHYYRLENVQRSVDALFLVNFFECGGDCKNYSDHILQWFETVAAGIDSILAQYGAEFGIITGVIVGSTDSSQLTDLIFALYDQFSSSQAAIFIVWTDPSGQVWFACIGVGCAAMSATQRRKQACLAAGKRIGCGAKEVEVIKLPSDLPPPPPGPAEITPG